jgi:geranylgeranyl pyrophosphate synthase
MSSAAFGDWVRQSLAAVEQALEAWVPAHAPGGLGSAMRYGVLDGGKRLRPLLVLATAQAVQGQDEAAMRAAVAVELIHAYSLIHDDMPCMDNDVLRRGKPTVHVKYGEAQAMLAGDAMQALAFEVLTPADGGMAAALQARLVGLLARSAGHAGMSGGQAFDLAQQHHLAVGVPLGLEQQRVHAHIGHRARGQRLKVLRTADLAAGHHTGVVAHVLRLERRDIDTPARRRAAQCRRDPAIAGAAAASPDDQGPCHGRRPAPRT